MRIGLACAGRWDAFFVCFIADNGFYGFDIVVVEPIYSSIHDDIMMHM